MNAVCSRRFRKQPRSHFLGYGCNLFTGNKKLFICVKSFHTVPLKHVGSVLLLIIGVSHAQQKNHLNALKCKLYNSALFCRYGLSEFQNKTQFFCRSLSTHCLRTSASFFLRFSCQELLPVQHYILSYNQPKKIHKQFCHWSLIIQLCLKLQATQYRFSLMEKV